MKRSGRNELLPLGWRSDRNWMLNQSRARSPSRNINLGRCHQEARCQLLRSGSVGNFAFFSFGDVENRRSIGASLHSVAEKLYTLDPKDEKYQACRMVSMADVGHITAAESIAKEMLTKNPQAKLPLEVLEKIRLAKAKANVQNY